MPETRSSEQVRDAFLAFFRDKGHAVVPSASLVPKGDPTLLFTNAGMNQFKDVFLGEGDRPYRRAVDTQKCLRVSGKHNDLEEVGLDTYHHTFFEMLGNWSFGDYFKQEAIRWAWELLVEQWGLEPDRLYATVHEGDETLGLDADEEAATYWERETTLPPGHILYCSSKDNFWMMGETGPCGPCSEVHIDMRPDEERARVPGRDLVNADDPRVIEIWNLVFIQYNAQADGRLEPLAAKHVDTGMGFERMVAVLQGKTSNYDTDLFETLLQALADRSPRKEIRGYDAIDVDDERERERIRVAMRVVADHVRTITFAIADGASPGNVGRGYVIRRILRRAVRFGYQALGFREPFLHMLIAPLGEKMGETFPEIVQQQDYIRRVTRAEEENFLETLGTGIAFFERITPYVEQVAAREETENSEPIRVMDELRKDRQTVDLLQKAYQIQELDALFDRFSNAAARRVIPGEVAFLLHDTYGFPVDLTQLMAREEGLGVDMARYEALMKEQRERARASASFAGEQSQVDRWTVVGGEAPSQFVGYDGLSVDDARVQAVRSIQVAEGETRHELVLDRTPFYAESGGQIGDVGILRVGDEAIAVLDTQRQQDRIVHVVNRLPSDLDAPVQAVVDAERRQRITKHHTATHLMHAALRELLGKHVAQKGSLVAPDRLRFDFSHYERVDAAQLRDVEARVNEVIQRNVDRQEERHVPIDQALARGATALFGEKYGDVVRVITFDPEYSMELCGGTHVDATGEIGVFRFLSEGSVAAGVRRVEAVVGLDALAHIDRELAHLERVRGQFRTLQRPVDEEVAALMEQHKVLQKEIDTLRKKNLAMQLDDFIKNGREVDDVWLVTGRLPNTDMDTLRALGETLRDRLGDGSVGVLGAADPDGEKAYLVAVVSDDLVQAGVQAGKLVGALAKRIGGGGGGRPQLATAGGREPQKLDEALAAAAEVLAV